MKLVLLLVITCLAVNCLGAKPDKNENRKPKPPQGGPPPKRSGSSNGWGWNTNKPPSCVPEIQIPVLSDSDMDLDFFSRQRLWYVTGQTAPARNAYFRILNGRAPNSQQEIEEMCRTYVYGSESPTVIISGSGAQFIQNCTKIGTNGSCYVTKDPATHDKQVDVFAGSEVLKYQFWLIATDSKNYALYYTCNDYQNGDLQLLTTRPYASPSDLKLFLSFFPRFNIPVSIARAPVCVAPKFNSPYPSPFQNYPHSSGNNGWDSYPPADNGWSSPPVDNGWSSPTVDNGWFSPPADNGWGSSGGWKETPKKGTEDKNAEAI